VNRVIDQSGVTLVPELVQATGRAPAEVVAAWFVVDRLLDADTLRRAVADAPVAESARIQAALGIEEAVRAAARARLGLESDVLLDPDEIRRWSEVAHSLRAYEEGAPDARASERFCRVRDALVALGFDQSLAGELAALPALARTLGLVPLAIRSEAALARAAAVHAWVGEHCGIAWLLERLAAATRRDPWERVAAESLWLEVVELERALCLRLLEGEGGPDGIEAFAARRADALRRIAETIRDVEADERGGLAALAVLAQEIRRL
jgi:NAD-specific glutamate dehydrogenase